MRLALSVTLFCVISTGLSAGVDWTKYPPPSSEKDGPERASSARFGVAKAPGAEAAAGDLVGAAESFRAILKNDPDNKAAKAALQRVLSDPAFQRQAADPYDAASFRGRPRDTKTVQLLFELLTPLVVGADLSFYSSRHHNWGVGYGGFSAATNSIYNVHPRYRYYRARGHWDSFFEVGGLFAGYHSQSGDSVYTTDFKGGDLGYGVNVINYGSLTMDFMVSLNVGAVNMSQPRTNWTSTWNGSYYVYNSTRVYEERSYFIGYPLIGFGWGWVF